jgi:hypothetical protein
VIVMNCSIRLRVHVTALCCGMSGAGRSNELLCYELTAHATLYLQRALEESFPL